MPIGPIITILGALGLVAGVVWLVRRERAARHQDALDRQHAPPRGAPTHDRAEQIRQGGTWPGGLR